MAIRIVGVDLPQNKRGEIAVERNSFVHITAVFHSVPLPFKVRQHVF